MFASLWALNGTPIIRILSLFFYILLFYFPWFSHSLFCWTYTLHIINSLSPRRHSLSFSPIIARINIELINAWSDPIKTRNLLLSLSFTYYLSFIREKEKKVKKEKDEELIELIKFKEMKLGRNKRKDKGKWLERRIKEKNKRKLNKMEEKM